MTAIGMNELRAELETILNERALAHLKNEPNALLAWVQDAEEAREKGHNSFEARGHFTASGNTEEIWLGEWFDEE